MVIQYDVFANRPHRVVPSEVTYQHLGGRLCVVYIRARINNIVKMVTTLLEHGADSNAKNAVGETPFSLLKANGLLRYFPDLRDVEDE